MATLMFRNFFMFSLILGVFIVDSNIHNIHDIFMLTLMQEVFMFTLQEVHRREQEIVEKNQNLVEMKRKNQMVSIISLRILTMMMRMVMMSMIY